MIFRLAVIVGALPVTLLNGTTADATQVMSDLNWIVNQVNANAAPLANTALTNANNNFTTVQSGQPATQAANFVIASQIENNSLQTLSSVLGTNTITGRIAALALGGYVSGQVFTFIPSNANTGAATLNIDGIGSRSILNLGSALSGAELQNNRSALVAFNNANSFDLVNGTPYVKGPNIPAAATLNLDGAFGDYSQVDGIATITAMTLSPGRQKLLEFTSSPQISNSASLILGTNVTPRPGDVFSFRGEAGGVVRATSSRLGGATYFSSSLAADVALNNISLYFDGPTVNQPNVGIWFACGTITFQSTTDGGGQVQAKLWDGNTVAASGGPVTVKAVNNFVTLSLSGIFVSPSGNIRISARNPITTTSNLSFNASGNSADCTVTAVRIG